MALFELVVAAQQSDPWVRFTGLATFTVAFVALFVGLIPPAQAALQRRRLRNTLSIALTTEIEDALLHATVAHRLTAQQRTLGATYNNATADLRSVSLPLLDRYLGQIEVFDRLTARALVSAHADAVRVGRLAAVLPKATAYVDPVDKALTDDFRGISGPFVESLGTALDAAARCAAIKIDKKGLNAAVDKLVTARTVSV